MEYKFLEHYCSEVKGVEPELSFGNTDDAGMDLRSSAPSDITLVPGADYVFPTGLQIHIGSDFFHDNFIINTIVNENEKPYPLTGLYGMIVPRSGLGFKHYTRLANTTGIIDAGYQKEIMVKIRNESDHDITIQRGERMCQMIFVPYYRGINFVAVEEFGQNSERGDGFGSSGKI